MPRIPVDFYDENNSTYRVTRLRERLEARLEELEIFRKERSIGQGQNPFSRELDRMDHAQYEATLLLALATLEGK